ncbi:MAG: hypothetical protein AB1705_05105 [Verrucomicrobiota bacterium]
MVAVCAVGLALLWRSEPTYQGKRLSEWAQQFGTNNWSANRAQAKEAEFAIQQIGTNAIPLLLELAGTRDSALKKRLRGVVPRKWHDRFRLRDNFGELRRTGAHGLAALGTNAAAAVPGLMEIATNHPDEDARYVAIFALRTLGSVSEPAIPLLVRCLTNNAGITNQLDIIRDEAAIGLGSIRRQPETCVPALIQYAEFAKGLSSAIELRDALGALALFGKDAKAAAPLFLSLTNHPDRDVRDHVATYLPMIDAEAAAKAGVGRKQ